MALTGREMRPCWPRKVAVCKEGKNASEYVANLADEELEKWYDETYQMLLLAMLEVDNIERNRKVNELKKKIEG